MSYQTGTATSPTNLLQTLVTWLVSIGWTQDASASDGAGWRAHLHKSGNYINLRAAVSETVWASGVAASGTGLHCYLGTGYSGASAWNAQAGGPIANGTSNNVGVGCNLPTGSIQNYYFLADTAGDNVVVVIEATAAIYKHLGWGLSLIKTGTWTGGPYFFGTNAGYNANFSGGGPGTTLTSSCPGCDTDVNGAQSCFIRVDVDAFTGKWIGVSAAVFAAGGYTGKSAASSVAPAESYVMRTLAPRFSDNWSSLNTWQLNQTSAVDGRANLLPIHLWAVRDTTGALSLLGAIPNVYLSNGVGNGFSPASEYVLGSTTYKMFPNFAVVKQ